MTDPIAPDALRDAVRDAMSWVDDEKALDAVLAVVAKYRDAEVESLRAQLRQADGWATARYNEAGVYYSRITQALGMLEQRGVLLDDVDARRLHAILTGTEQG